MRILRAFLRAGVHNLLNAYKMRNGYTARSSALRATTHRLGGGAHSSGAFAPLCTGCI